MARTVDPRALAARLAPHLVVVRREGPGPFPVVVQMHGCGGVQPLQMRYAQAARRAGVAAVIVDSLAPRALSRAAAHLTVCTGLALRGAERAQDLVATLHWLEGETWADTTRVAAAGWSHGGWAIMEALVGAGREGARPNPVDALRLVVLVYPYAGPLSRTRVIGWGARRPRVAACLGGRDAVVGRAGPARALDRLRNDGLEVEVLTIPDATHAFDDDRASDPRTAYDPRLAEQAEAFFVQSLRQTLLPGRARPSE